MAKYIVPRGQSAVGCNFGDKPRKIIGTLEPVELTDEEYAQLKIQLGKLGQEITDRLILVEDKKPAKSVEEKPNKPVVEAEPVAPEPKKKFIKKPTRGRPKKGG